MLTRGIPPDFLGRHPFIYLNRHTPSGQSRAYRVTQLRNDGVHCRESAGIGPVILKVVPVSGTAILQVKLKTIVFQALNSTDQKKLPEFRTMQNLIPKRPVSEGSARDNNSDLTPIGSSLLAGLCGWSRGFLVNRFSPSMF